MRKDKEIKVRMTSDNLARLDRAVLRTNLSREEYVRRAIAKQKIHENPPAEYGNILREIRRIGGNLNQLINIARAHGFVDERELKKIQNDVRNMDELFRRTFCGK